MAKRDFPIAGLWLALLQSPCGASYVPGIARSAIERASKAPETRRSRPELSRLAAEDLAAPSANQSLESSHAAAEAPFVGQLQPETGGVEAPDEPSPRISNFGRTVVFTPRRRYAPRDERALLDILNKHRNGRIRAAGSRHSWSPLIETPDVLLTMERFNDVRVDGDRVIVGGGTSAQKILDALRPRNLTLQTLGEI